MFTREKYSGAVKSFYYDIEPLLPINLLRVYIHRSRDAEANLDGPHVDSIVLLTSRLKYVIDINRSHARVSYHVLMHTYQTSGTCIMYISAPSSYSYNHQKVHSLYTFCSLFLYYFTKNIILTLISGIKFRF